MTATEAIDVVPRKITRYNGGGEGDIPIATLSRSRPNYDSLTNVNVNGCFESDRVIKSGYVEKRTKTKVCAISGHIALNEPMMAHVYSFNITNSYLTEMENGIPRHAAEYACNIQERKGDKTPTSVMLV